MRLDPPTTQLLAAQPDLRAARWLDAACGDGKGLVALAETLAAAAPPVVGLDASRWALRRAAEAMNARGLPRHRAVLVRADLRRLPFARGSFQAVRAVHALGHLDAAARPMALAGLAGLLAPGGVVVLSEFGTGDFRAGTGECIEPGTYRRGTGIATHYFTREELAALAERAGLTAVLIEPQTFKVSYGGQALPRERWDLVALRPDPVTGPARRSAAAAHRPGSKRVSSW